MILTKLSFFTLLLCFTTQGHCVTALNFFQTDHQKFNRVFLQRQIDWSVSKFFPNLKNIEAFTLEKNIFIENESSQVFFPHPSKDLRFLKYFIRAKVKNSQAYDFQIGFVFNNKVGSLWDNSGQVKNIKFFAQSNKEVIPDACRKNESFAKASYFEFNTTTQACSPVQFTSLLGHPLFTAQIDEYSTAGPLQFLQSKMFYPDLIANGTPDIQRVLMKEWRLGISRVYNGPKHSIIYFP